MTLRVADFAEDFQISQNGTEYGLSQLADDDKEELVLELEELADEEAPDEEVVLLMDEDTISDLLPGANVPMMRKEEIEDAHEPDWENDRDATYFIVYLEDRVSKVPAHSGNTTVGCEKAISYFRRLDKELSDAVRGDEDNKIDEQAAESLRDTIYDSISRLEDAHDQLMGKYKKKAALRVGKKVVARIKDGTDIQYFISVGSLSGDETLLQVEVDEPTNKQVAQFVEGQKLQGDFQKEASAGVYLFEDPFLHSITRLLIQGHITHGKDMNEIYGELKTKYDFTPREELSIHELLYQKGFPLIKDFARVGEDKVRPQDNLGTTQSAEYYS